MAVAAFLLGGAALMVYLLRDDRTLNHWAGLTTVGGFAVAAASLGLQVAEMLRGRRAAAASLTVTDRLAAAADTLAERTLQVWSAEAGGHDLDQDKPIPVSWAWDKRRSRAFREVFPGQGAPPQGVVADLYEQIYTRLPHDDHMVLVGDKGAGKSAAMLLLLLDALQDRARTADPVLRAGMPVPVWVTVGGWNPEKQSLRALITEAMQWMLPALRNPLNYGPQAADRLLDCGAVAVFLDGLDEIPADLRKAAMNAVATEASAVRVVVTARPEGYVQGRRPGGRPRVPVVLRLAPLTPEAIANQLVCGHAGAELPAWESLAEHVRAHPGGTVAMALNSPLFVSLALAAYAAPFPAGHDPRDLIAAASEQGIREGVIELFLDRVYPPDQVALQEQEQRRQAITGRPSRNPIRRLPGRRIRARRRRRDRDRSLAFLAWTAHHMGTNPDLRWWLIPGWVSQDRLAGAAMLPTAFLGAVMLAAASAAAGQSLLRMMLWAMVGAGVGGTMGNLAFNRLRQAGAQPAALRPRWPTAGEARYVLRQGAVMSLPFVIGVGLHRGLWPGIAAGLPLFLAGVFGGNISESDRGLLTVWSRPLANAPATTPLQSHRADAYRTAAFVVGSGIITTLLLMIAGSVDGQPSFGLRYGPAIGADFGWLLGLGPAVVLLVTPLACSRRHRLGQRSFAQLLRTAHDLKVMRQAGAVYQFRHAELQGHLARRHSPNNR